MLCPEVWNFAPPSSSVSFKFCESEEEIFSIIKKQYFHHFVSLILPNTLQAPVDLVNTVLDDSQFYRVENISAAEFFDKNFSDLFVKKGQLTAISINEFPDQNNCLSFIPCGKLILLLTKKTYVELGIEGKLIKQSKTASKEYSLVLDVTEKSNQLGKNWKQIHNKLKSCQHLYFDIVLAWEPNDINICPSSIALYFSQKGYKVKTCDIQFNQRLTYNVNVPIFDKECDLMEFTEWLGSFSLQCNMSDDSYISTMKCPDRHDTFGQVIYLSFSGLITNSRVKQLISEIRNYITARASSGWISLTVQGFEDSVINFKDKYIHLSEGNQHQTIIFKSSHSFLVYSFQDLKK